jgi:hypothetical protein
MKIALRRPEHIRASSTPFDEIIHSYSGIGPASWLGRDRAGSTGPNALAAG